MKRLQVMIDDDADAEPGRRAAHEGTSRAALVRRLIDRELHRRPPADGDPVGRMAEADDFEPARVDDVVYPR